MDDIVRDMRIALQDLLNRKFHDLQGQVDYGHAPPIDLRVRFRWALDIGVPVSPNAQEEFLYMWLREVHKIIGMYTELAERIRKEMQE